MVALGKALEIRTAEIANTLPLGMTLEKVSVRPSTSPRR
jgi:hypothetical protein